MKKRSGSAAGAWSARNRAALLMPLAILSAAALSHYTQSDFTAVDCTLGIDHYLAALDTQCATLQPCHYDCAAALSVVREYEARCGGHPPSAATADALSKAAATISDIDAKCGVLEPWRINGAALTVLPCGAPADAPDGVDAHVAELRAFCPASSAEFCAGACREPYTVLTNHNAACGGAPPPEVLEAKDSGCASIEPAADEPCACAAAAAGWELSCYNEEAMLAAAAALRNNGCDEMEPTERVPRCAIPGHHCRDDFQQVQAHHDYCHAQDVPSDVRRRAIRHNSGAIRFAIPLTPVSSSAGRRRLPRIRGRLLRVSCDARSRARAARVRRRELRRRRARRRRVRRPRGERRRR